MIEPWRSRCECLRVLEEDYGIDIYKEDPFGIPGIPIGHRSDAWIEQFTITTVYLRITPSSPQRARVPLHP